MAYDPEARQTGNSAMIIGIVALVLIAGAVLAYTATRHNDAEDANGTTIIDNRTVIATPTPITNTVIISPTPNTVVPGKTVTRVERNTTVIDRTAPPAANTTITAPPPNVTTNVTVAPSRSNNSAATPATAAPSPSDEAANNATNSASNSTAPNGY